MCIQVKTATVSVLHCDASQFSDANDKIELYYGSLWFAFDNAHEPLPATAPIGYCR